MDTASVLATSTGLSRCKTCRKPCLSIYSSFKNCGECRSKNRIKEREKTERKRKIVAIAEKMRQSMMQKENQGIPRMVAALDSDDSEDDEDENSIGEEQVLKPKTKLLHELEGKEKQRAMDEMRAVLQKNAKSKVSSVNAHVANASQRESERIKEYQTASIMYERLKTKRIRSSDASRPLDFSGCHSVIAVATIDHAQRSKMVVRDLRKIARISFEETSISKSRLVDHSNLITVFQCRCLGSSPSFGSAQLGKLQKEALECGGLVTITVESDTSHPCGIAGQKISIRVHHDH